MLRHERLSKPDRSMSATIIATSSLNLLTDMKGVLSATSRLGTCDFGDVLVCYPRPQVLRPALIMPREAGAGPPIMPQLLRNGRAARETM